MGKLIGSLLCIGAVLWGALSPASGLLYLIVLLVLGILGVILLIWG
jgi:hypothetical protein